MGNRQKRLEKALGLKLDDCSDYSPQFIELIKRIARISVSDAIYAFHETPITTRRVRCVTRITQLFLFPDRHWYDIADRVGELNGQS